MTYALIGSTALRIALLLTVWGVGAAIYAATRKRSAFLWSARFAALGATALVGLATLVMVLALLRHDFSIRYVAFNNALETPPFYSAVSLWAALEGSILLWTLVLAAATAWVAWRGTHALPRVGATATVVLFALLAFFLVLVTTGAADPFALLPSDQVPGNGRGPNPLLQEHPLMAVHPPLLYLGYVLFSIPFAYAIAALILGEMGDRWLLATRQAALASWVLLGLGLAAGGRWGYAVLGWGGYWAWDPVENAALMPWLTATAYLHSIVVEEKRGMLRIWNLTLVIATFALTILGTFLTRSGILNSVHSFSQSAIGPLLFGLLAGVLVFSFALLVWRLPALRDSGAVGAPLSREAVFLFQNVFFVAATLVVLLGTLYPLAAEALSGQQLSIGAPYFDRIEVPIGLALLFLMGVGPQLPWHGASRATLERQFTLPLVAAALGALVAVAPGLPGPFPVLTAALAAFASATIAQEFVRGVRARRALHGEGNLLALARLFQRNGRRYGGYVVHFGIVLIAVGIAASQAWTVEVERTLAPGDSLSAAGYSVALAGIRDVDEPQRRRISADLVLRTSGGEEILAPSLLLYPFATQALAAPGIRTGLDVDVYTLLAAYDGRQGAWATIRLRVIPLVSWIWIGSCVVGLGALLAALPVRRRAPRPFGVSPAVTVA